MTASTRTPGQSWVISPGVDMTLIVCLPLAVIPAAYLLIEKASAGWFAFVVTIFASGHLLPTFLRIFADKALVKRFPWRFLVLPPLLLACYLAADYFGIFSLKYLVVIWGFWHGFMQTYGISRIYEAKAGGKPTPVRTDWLFCLTWLVGGTLHSEIRMAEIVEGYYWLGLPPIPASLLPVLQTLWLGLAVVASLLFAWHLLRLPRQGSWLKLLHTGVSLSFWWFCMAWSPNIFCGVAMWEIFHDVQYMAVTWAAGERLFRADGSGIKRVFRRTWPYLALYTCVVGLFGALSPLSSALGRAYGGALIAQLLVTCNVLHFYYDGFIWKLRDAETKAALNLNPAATGRSLFASQRGGRHALLWSLIAAAIFALTTFQFLQPPLSPLLVQTRTTDTLPASAVAHFRRSQLLSTSGATAEAYVEGQVVERLSPEFPGLKKYMGSLARGMGRFADATSYLRQYLSNHVGDFDAFKSLGLAEGNIGLFRDAARHLEHAARLSPDDVEVHYLVGRTRAELGEYEAAVVAFTRAVALKPEWQAAATNLELAKKAARARL